MFGERSDCMGAFCNSRELNAMKTRLGILLLLSLAASPARAALFEQLPSHGGGMQLRVADDFVLADSILVSGFTFWGGYNNGPTVDDTFTIRLYGDALGQPGTLLHDSAPATVTRSPTGATVLSGIYPEYLYTVTLGTPVQTQGGTRYWLSIVNVMPEAEIWQWEISSDSDSPGIQRFEDNAWQPHSVPGTAFTVIPEPGSLSLCLCSFGALLVKFRRRQLATRKF